MKLFNKINSRCCNLILLIIAVAALTTFSGCKKGFLDRDPQGKYTQDNYPYPGGSGPYDTYLFGAYSELRDYNVHSQFYISAVSIRSDDADKGSTPADGGANAKEFDDFPVSPGNSYTNGLWVGYFSLVNKCNIVLDQIRNNTTIVASDGVKAQSEAEAKFLRGYAYFMLVRLFGRVPIIDSVFTDAAAQSNVAQSETPAIYSFIENDLTFAAAHLPLSWDPKFVGRATRGAANGLLAKVYLTEKKWQQAMTTAGMVISSGQYDLSTPYDKIFGEDGENSSGSVFEVQATASATTPTANGVQYAPIQGVRGTGDWNLGWGWNTPSTYLVAAYEPDDPREQRTIMFTSTPDTTYTSIYGETIPVGLPNPRYNNKVYTNPAWRASVQNKGGWWMNIRIIRYSDVLLMYAEAANEVGNTPEALDKLEMVRARARAGNPGILPEVTTTDKDDLRQAIHHERRVELGMEQDRFFDLVRWGTAAQALHAAGKPNFTAGRDELLPIPQVQIDLSKGKLTQNFGY